MKKVADKDEIFMREMTNFFNDAQKMMQETEISVKTTRTDFQELLKFFGYKPREVQTTDPSEFFENISSFMEKFSKSLEQIKKEEQKRTAPKKAQLGQKISSYGKGEDAMSAVVDNIKSELAATK